MRVSPDAAEPRARANVHIRSEILPNPGLRIRRPAPAFPHNRVERVTRQLKMLKFLSGALVAFWIFFPRASAN